MTKLLLHVLTNLSCLILMATDCAADRPTTPNLASGVLIFQSGFEPESHITPRGDDVDIAGVDRSAAAPNDWVKDFDDTPDRGHFLLQFQGGDPSERDANIIPEPGNPTNHVLRFWLDAPNVNGGKGRVQADIYGMQRGLKEFYQSERVFFTEEFNTLRTYPDSFHWLTIAEFWNNIAWGPKVSHAFRVTLGIGKPSKEAGPLRFIVGGQDFTPGIRKTYKTIWHKINSTVDVPVGRWFTLEYYYKEGDEKSGRIYLAIQPEGGPRQEVFDVTHFTHNTHDPAPNGVTDFNPMKLYTSKELIAHMHSHGKSLEIYWDDFKLWENRRP